VATMDKKTETGLFGNYFLKLLFIVLSCLVGIVGYFITDKLKQIDNKLEKIDQLEQKVQALNKSQIQIMTHLKIPIPDYLYTTVYKNASPFSHPALPKSEENIKYQYLAVEINKKHKFMRDRRL
jgi:hypothetical protein